MLEKAIPVGNDSSGWSKGNCLYNPGANFIDLWRVDISSPELDRYQECLSSDERQRADKFILDEFRNTFVRSRCALRLLLARCLDHQAPTHARAIEFRYGNQGKPELASPAPDDFQFNLSHSADIALIVVAKGRTDNQGRFSFTGDASLDTAVIGKFEQAANIPQRVVTELRRKERSPEDETLIRALNQLQEQVNQKTDWGRKVSRWIAAQQTAVSVDSNRPAPAWYDPIQDTIVINPHRALPRAQQLQ